MGHHKRNGKDQFAIFIIDVLRKRMKNLEVTRSGFADKLYDFCHAAYSWGGMGSRLYYVQHPEMKEIVLPKLGKTPRQVLIDVGNHMRLYDPNIWLNACCRGNKVGALQIITDMRFPNEYQALESYIRVKVTRPGFESTSEADIPLNGVTDWHHVIMNDGTLHDLTVKAQNFVDSVLIPKIKSEV